MLPPTPSENANIPLGKRVPELSTGLHQWAGVHLNNRGERPYAVLAKRKVNAELSPDEVVSRKSHFIVTKLLRSAACPLGLIGNRLWPEVLLP